MQFNIKGELWSLTYKYGSLNCCASNQISDLQVWRGHNGIAAFNGRHPTQEELEVMFEGLYSNDQGGTVIPFKAIKTQVVFISPVDYGAPAGNKGDKSVLYTQQFVQWLIDKKNQFVITTPVFANTNYPKDGASLCQFGIWFPDFLVGNNRILPDSAGVYNEPTDEQYAAATKELNPKADLFAENFAPDKNLVASRLAKAKLAWEKGRGYVNGLPPVRQKKMLKWGT